jgi:outer membrane protein W
MNRIERHSLTLLRLAVLAAAVITLTVTSTAFAEEPLWNLRFRGAIVSSNEAFSVDNSAGGSTIAGGNAAPGIGVAAERRFTDRYGLELATLFAKVPDTEVTDSTGQDTEVDEGPSFAPISVSFNVHLTPERKVDIYVAPTVAFVMFGDFDLEVDGQTTKYETDDEVAWGASAGADIRLGERWSFNVALSYLDTDMEVTEIGSDADPVVVSFDPLIVSAGATLRF